MVLAWVCSGAGSLGVSYPPKAIPPFRGEGDWVSSQMRSCALEYLQTSRDFRVFMRE